MAWEECLTAVQNIAGQSVKVQEVTNVDWSKISQQDLDNQFQGDKPFPLICPDRHCLDNVDISPAAHNFCSCKDINGNNIPNCTPKNLLTPMSATVCLDVLDSRNSSNYGKAGRNCTKLGDSYYILNCYCCCSCYANGTLIAVPSGFKKIEDFNLGDKVMAASIDKDGGLVWEHVKVGFSFGTGGSVQPGMVYLHYGETGSMVCTPDQLFLLKTGKIKRADRLVPGLDQLTAPNGDAVDLHDISLGVYEGGIHHIATQTPFKGHIQGHLLNSAGIVTGDFDLQIHAPDLKDKFFVENHDQLPVVGSSTYTAAYSELAKTDIATYSLGQLKPALAKSLQFFAYQEKRYNVPAEAASYLSNPQAIDVAKAKLNVTFDKVSQNHRKVQNLLKTFSGHYPAIKFVFLQGHMEVNAFAYIQQDQQFVALTDGLARLHGMDVEGLALILAHLINRLSMSPPIGENEWMSVAFADYLSGGIIKDLYLEQSGVLFSKGEKQIEDVLFNHISSVNNPYAGDPYLPTTEKRLDAFDAGYSMGFPPLGIGGPEQGGLQVIGATVNAPQFDAASFVTRDITEADSKTVFKLLTDKGILDPQGALKLSVTPKTNLSFLFLDIADPDMRIYLIETVRSILINVDNEVVIRFNLSIGNQPVHPDDFEFTPKAVVDGVSKSEAGDTVLVKVPLNAGIYAVTVTDIVSSIGSTLSPDHNSAEFTVK